MSGSPRVIFWVSREQGTCRWNGDPWPPSDQRLALNGGVCAFQEDIERTYICPAPDARCWYTHDNCVGPQINGSMSPGADQHLCTNLLAEPDTDKTWCCFDQALCPTDSSSWKICLSSWRSPVAGLDASAAQEFMSSVLGTTSVGTTTVLDNAPAYTTLTITPSTAISGGRTTSTSLEGSTATSDADRGDISAQPHDLSGGAIAGITIGVVLGLILVTMFSFWIGRRNGLKRSLTSATSDKHVIPRRNSEGRGTVEDTAITSASGQRSEIMTHMKAAETELP